MKRLYVLFTLILLVSSYLYISAEQIDKTMIVITEAGLRLRESPDTTGKVIITIPYKTEVKFIEEKGDTITISGKYGKWTKISWKGKTGWAFGGFLAELDKSDLTPEQEADILKNNIDINEIYGKRLECNNIPDASGQSAYLTINKNKTFHLFYPKYAGDASIDGKVEIITSYSPIRLKLYASKAKCQDMGQDYKCSFDESEIEIDKSDGKIYITGKVSLCGDWNKFEFRLSK